MNAADRAEAAAVLAQEARRGMPPIPHEQVMAALDALDRADAASSVEEAAEILALHQDVLRWAETARGGGAGIR